MVGNKGIWKGNRWRREDQIQYQILENIIFKSTQNIFETIFKNTLNDRGGGFTF